MSSVFISVLKFSRATLPMLLLHLIHFTELYDPKMFNFGDTTKRLKSKNEKQNKMQFESTNVILKTYLNPLNSFLGFVGNGKYCQYFVFAKRMYLMVLI